MELVSIFDWAQVKLAEEYLRLILKADVSKQHIVSQLADAGGVNVIWDENGTTKLEGSWEHIVKAQMVFEDYLRSLAVWENRTAVLSGEKSTLVGGAMKSDTSLKKTAPVNNPVIEENEVYVNITLSSTDISGLQEPNQMMNCIQANNSNKDTSDKSHSDDKPNISDYKMNSFEESFLTKSKLERSIEDCKQKENVYNISGCQQEMLYNISSMPLCNNEKSKDAAKSSSHHSNFDENNHEFHAGSRLQKSVINGSVCSKNIPHLVNDPQRENSIEHSNINHAPKHENLECESMSRTSSFDADHNIQVKSKYLKKKDYEELAPFKFFCSLCSFKSKRESHFQRHMKLHNEVSELFKCSHCNFTSIRLSHLRRHELDHSNLTLACNVCRYRTNNQKLLIRHKRIKHSATKMSEVKKEIFRCVHCEYQTSRYYLLQRHLRVHVTDASTVQVYQCEQCSYKTNRKEHFVRHTDNIHKGQRPFLCHRCGKAFKRQDALKQHSSIHATQAAVSCPDCGKGCRSQAHLSQHLSVHSSERSFLCELCGASFKTRAVQRKHMFTIHQHPKAFFCSHCSRKFSTKFALRRHVKQHSLLSSVEKRPKQQDQQTTTTTTTTATATATATLVHEGSSSMKLVAMDTIFFSESSRPRASEQTGADTSQEGEKITLQLTETYETEALRVIPTQTVMQPNNEATAVVYLAGTFTPL